MARVLLYLKTSKTFAGSVFNGSASTSERVPLMAQTRPSLLRSVFLADGSLAWPVAEGNGISEMTFRARLKRGMSPDKAATEPVVSPEYAGFRARQRNRVRDSRAARSAARVAAFGNLASVPVLVDGDERIAVHANGSAYLLQSIAADGEWSTDYSASCPSLLRRFAVHSTVLYDALGALPENPAEWLSAWALGQSGDGR